MSIPTFVKDARGNWYLNSLKRYVKGAVLTPDESQIPIVIASAPSATSPSESPPIVLEGGEDALSEVFSLVGEHDSIVLPDVAERMTVSIRDSAYRRVLMNKPILVNHIFGNNLQPSFLSESIMLQAQQVLQLKFFNHSTAGSTSFRFLMEHRKFQSSVTSNIQVTQQLEAMRKRKPFITPYWLTVSGNDNFIQLTPGQSRTIFFDISRDIFLFIHGIMAQVINITTPGSLLENNFEFRIKDPKTKRPLILNNSKFIPETCGVGTARFPYQLPGMIIAEPNTKLEMEIRSLHPTDTQQVFFTFQCTSLFVAPSNLFVERAEIPMPTPYSRGAP